MTASSQHLSASASSSLLARVRTHDARAWQRLARLYGPVVYQWARHAGLQQSDALDVGQEVFRTLLARLDDYRGSRVGDSFRGWLWGITRNKLREYFRRRAALPVGEGGTDGHLRFAQLADQLPADSAQFDPSDIRSGVLRRAMELIQGEFEAHTMQAFWQSTVDGRSTVDIAAELQMTAKAVRQAKYRVLRRLREELAELI